MKKSFNIITSTLIFFIASLIGAPFSQAVDQCFSNLPDSAWQNGEPQEVKNQLNYDLVGNQYRTYSDGQVFSPYDWFNSKDGILVNSIKYEYLGKNCLKRTILIQKNIEVPKPTFITKEDIILSVKSKSSNFVEESESLQKIDKSIAVFQKNNTVQMKSARITMNSYLIRNNLPETFMEEAYGIVSLKGVGGAIIGNVYSNNCKFDTRSNASNAAFLHSAFLSIVFEKSNSCGTRWYLLDQNNRVFPLGELMFTKEETIQCSKGKLTKTVTGTNPQCPKWYKKVS